mmetsp:Transcript_2229/g.9663  ORF Transcript_2229/g.9663 Transcript_2229/m.9663 type:complete len:360 (+) Transcript_2229:608-1687(+)
MRSVAILMLPRLRRSRDRGVCGSSLSVVSSSRATTPVISRLMTCAFICFCVHSSSSFPSSKERTLGRRGSESLSTDSTLSAPSTASESSRSLRCAIAWLRSMKRRADSAKPARHSAKATLTISTVSVATPARAGQMYLGKIFASLGSSASQLCRMAFRALKAAALTTGLSSSSMCRTKGTTLCSLSSDGMKALSLVSRRRQITRACGRRRCRRKLQSSWMMMMTLPCLRRSGSGPTVNSKLKPLPEAMELRASLGILAGLLFGSSRASISACVSASMSSRPTSIGSRMVSVDTSTSIDWTEGTRKSATFSLCDCTAQSCAPTSDGSSFAPIPWPMSAQDSKKATPSGSLVPVSWMRSSS